MIHSLDNKILSWDKKDRDSFINSFTEEELESMASELRNHSFAPLNCEEDERTDTLVMDYAKRWLYEQIEYGIHSNTRELFEVVYAMM